MITTERLIIRPLEDDDYIRVYECCNDYDVVRMTLAMPWPYTEECAKSWIASTLENFKNGKSYEFGICLKDKPKSVVGCVSLVLGKGDAKKAELGYWVDKKLWGNGIATEATKALINYGFNDLGLNSIFARHYDINPASGRVMTKVGMRYVGRMRQHECRFGEYHDVEYYDLLNTDIR